MEHIRQQRTSSPTARPPKHRILLVGDSNARRVAQQLQTVDRMFKTDYIEAVDLDSATTWIETIEAKPDNTTVTLLVGTNDIRRGKNATLCDQEHQLITDTMNNLGIQYVVVQAPPIYAVQLRHRHQEREVVKFNTKHGRTWRRPLPDRQKRRNTPNTTIEPNGSNPYRKPHEKTS